jgi:hypothetical protein
MALSQTSNSYLYLHIFRLGKKYIVVSGNPLRFEYFLFFYYKFYSQKKKGKFKVALVFSSGNERKWISI